MNIVRMIVTASVAGMLIAAPVSLAQAVDAHHQGATTKKSPKKKPATARQSGPMMAMGGMKMGGAGMHGVQAGKGGKMQCPMMSGASAPMHSPRMQWHHSMMMWHHKMMHSGS